LTFAVHALQIVVLSGPIGAGKSALADKLAERYGAQVIKTRDLIRKQSPNVKEERGALQRAGERLDASDGGAWVKNALVRFIEDNVKGPEPSGLFVIDAARIPGQVKLLVRVGGPNAGHKVYADGDPEVYYHLPSGTERAAKAELLLGAGAVINPPKLLHEIATHHVDAERLSIDPQAMIIEDADMEQEKMLLQSISSTAQGVGAAAARKIMGRGGGLNPSVRLARDVPELKPFIRDGQMIFERAFTRGDRVLLEGTQGTSLSLHHGTYPWVTSRDTTVAECLADAGIASTRVRRVIMACRTYPIRVGGPSGHMTLEITYEELAARSGVPIAGLKNTETTTTTKRQRRLAEFDWEQLLRSTMLNGPTDIALTFVDYHSVANGRAFRFDQLDPNTVRFIQEVERVSGVPSA
jgi:adenylosuccinate synthase